MSAYGVLQDFMNKWNQDHQGPDAVKVFPDVSDGIILGFKLRFNGARFPIDGSTFRRLMTRVYANSKNQLRVTSKLSDFRAGSLKLEVRETHQRFSAHGAKKTLEFLLTEVFPDLRSQRNRKLSRWQVFQDSVSRRFYSLVARLFLGC